jgi:hypothetical protein
MHKIIIVVTLILAGNPTTFAQADMPKPTYDFSLSRESKIKLAESAAPPEISDKATVYSLERTGYVRVRDGTNGFSCFENHLGPPLSQRQTKNGKDGKAQLMWRGARWRVNISLPPAEGEKCLLTSPLIGLVIMYSLPLDCKRTRV